MVEGAEGAASAPVSAAQPGSGLPGDGDGSPPVGNKRPRKAGAAAELTAVKAQLMERGVPGVDSRTSVPTLIQLLVQHGLANREAFPDAGYWKIGGGGQRNTSKFAGPEAARGWRVWLDKGETAEQQGRDGGASDRLAHRQARPPHRRGRHARGRRERGRRTQGRRARRTGACTHTRHTAQDQPAQAPTTALGRRGPAPAGRRPPPCPLVP